MPNLKWIAQPLTAFAFSMLVMLNLLLLLFWYSPTIATLNKATDQQGASLVRSLAFDATAALNSGNRAALSNILNHFTETGLVISATVTSVDDSIRLNALVMNAPNQGRSFRHPIDFSSDILGYAELVIDETPIQRWHQQAISSWVFFNLTGLVSLGGFIFWRSRQHQAAWRLIREQLASQFPSVHRQLAGSPEQQLTKLMAILGEPLNQQGQLMKHLGQRYGSSDTERLLEQIELVGDEGRYGDIAL
ncbi:MAG: putative membrane protein affecting hemolysin expression, partial [Reinekea sp.]